MAPALRGIPRGAVGHDDLTDAPNFGTEFGRRRPFPRYGVLRLRPPQGVGHDDPGVPRRGCPERSVVAGHPLRGFHPHFLFAAAKRKRRWSRQKKKRLSLRSYGRVHAPCRAAGCGPKRSCSMDAAPTRTRAGLLAGYRTWYAVLNKEVIGQNLNLTSYSFRAFRFAKRCPGGRGGGPPFGMVLASIPAHPLAPAGADASLRAGWLGWLIGLSVGADDLGGPNPRPS